jgi:hypothetical protein
MHSNDCQPVGLRVCLDFIFPEDIGGIFEATNDTACMGFLKILYSLSVLITTLWAPCLFVGKLFGSLATLIRKFLIYCFGLRNRIRVAHGVSVRMINAIEIDPAGLNDEYPEPRNRQVFLV